MSNTAAQELLNAATELNKLTDSQPTCSASRAET